MDVTPETSEQTDARLLRVMAQAKLTVFDEPYVFAHCSAEQFPTQWLASAKAFVRDEQVWSALMPASKAPQSQEHFKLLSFHFDAGVPNSGFVGWLASLLKRELGTGVFVVCGDNPQAGGIFDYWGVPWAVADQATALIENLMRPS
jgi:hypothetical protein